jgi:hypothetical protein
MAKTQRQTHQKRAREAAVKERRDRKLAKKHARVLERRAEEESSEAGAGGWGSSAS